MEFSAQMALFARNLSRICRLLGTPEDAPAYEAVHAQTKEAINAFCWDAGDGFYYDLGYGQRIRRKHIGMFWTLLAGVVPEARVEQMLAHLTRSSEFWRRVPLASFPADQAGFSADGNYWLGSVWAPTNFMVIRGLGEIGRADLALRLAREYYRCVAAVFEQTGTFWENYAPDVLTPGSQSRRDFCGWTALVPIALLREFGARLLPA